MTSPQHSAEIDRKARELLAAEYRTIGDITCANAISTDPDICGREKLAIRAIEAALSLTPPAATDGRELPEPDYVETIPASHFKDEPTARHWYSAETLRRMMQATTSAAAVPEGWVFEILTNIKRSAIRGRNAAGTPDNALASSFVATCDHIENLADQALSAAPQPAAVKQDLTTDDAARSGIVKQAIAIMRDMPDSERIEYNEDLHKLLQGLKPEAKTAVTADELIRQVEEAKRQQMERDIDPGKQPNPSTDDIPGARTVQGSTATHAYYERPEALTEAGHE